MSSFFWERYCADMGNTQRWGGALQALRRGAHSEPAAAPSMWPYYTQLSDNGTVTRRLRAEHICLVSFGIHQQGIGYAAHQKEIGLGEALRHLRASDRFSTDAIDDRVERLATANTMDEVLRHLSSLVQLVRATKQHIAIDYTKLFWNLVTLQDENLAGRVRREWGSAYFRPDTTPSSR